MEEGQLLPYRRCYRPMMVDGKLDWNSGAAYIQKPEYARDGAMFVRSFYHIQEELQYLFKYIEPASGNLNTYSHAIQQLLILVCVEVEANFKAIFKDNKYTTKKEQNWTIYDYSRINVSHLFNLYRTQRFGGGENDHELLEFFEWE